MPNLTRRQVLKATGAASLGLMIPGPRAEAQTGIVQSVARWCFEDIPLQSFCASVAEMGLTAMDLLLVDEWAVAHDHGLVVSCGDVGAGTIEDGLNEPRNHAGIIRAFEEQIPRAAREGVRNVICFFGNRRGMEDAPAIDNSIRCLRECAPIAEAEGVTILVEALNSKPGGQRSTSRRNSTIRRSCARSATRASADTWPTSSSQGAGIPCARWPRPWRCVRRRKAIEERHRPPPAWGRNG